MTITPSPTRTPRNTSTPINVPTSYPATPTATREPTSVPTDLPTPLPGYTETTINYVYDPLYRLTEANYSTGVYYHYAYDATGNRITQTTYSSVTSLSYNGLGQHFDKLSDRRLSMDAARVIFLQRFYNPAILP